MQSYIFRLLISFVVVLEGASWMNNYLTGAVIL
jgi:hypothetical protein